MSPGGGPAPGAGDPDEWGRERLADLVSLCRSELHAERLTADELEACCWDDPGTVVVGLEDERGPLAAGVVCTPARRPSVASVKLLVVRSDAQRRGVGRQLLDELERWAAATGAAAIQLGGSVPSYLWPGVDVRHLGMLCLAEAAGYRPTGLELNMSLATSFRRPPPAGVRIERVLDDRLAAAVLAWTDATFPHWSEETATAIEGGGCIAALAAVSAVADGTPAAGGAPGDGTGGDGGDGSVDGSTPRVLAVGCHSVNRAGWVGPMATAPDRQARGTGSAVLAAICTDLMVAGIDHAEVSWVGPVRFYAKAGGTVSRAFRSCVKDL